MKKDFYLVLLCLASSTSIASCFAAGIELPESEKYTKVYRAYESRRENKSLTPCDKLDDLRTTLVTLNQVRGTYWMDWCLRDWPCAVTTHRANIDKITEQLDPISLRLKRECSLQMQNDTLRKIGIDGSLPKTETKSDSKSNAASTSASVQGNYTHNHQPHYTINFPEVPAP